MTDRSVTDFTQPWPWMQTPLGRPTIVCLCGSTRFGDAFDQAMLDETLAGNVVLTIGTTRQTDADLFGHLPTETQEAIFDKLGKLHFAKIDMADEILVLNVGGYTGRHTQAEIDYAQMRRKVVRFLEEWTP